MPQDSPWEIPNSNRMKSRFYALKLPLILAMCAFAPQFCAGQYATGDRVFRSKFSSEVKDYSQDTYIRIENSSDDIIVAVENVYTGKVIQHAYILARDTYDFTYIPVGTYVCKYMWTDKFGNRRYEKDNQNMTFSVNEVGGYVITLTETVYGNLTQSAIGEDDFFDR